MNIRKSYFTLNDLSRWGNYYPPFGAVTNIFDYIGGAYVAYSLRRLTTSYTGPTIDVRREDNVTTSIGFNSNGDLDTTTLLAFAGTSSVFVPRMYDQSGNGFHKIQPTASLQPSIVISGSLNYIPSSNRPCLFYKNGDRLYTIFPDAVTSGSAFVVNSVAAYAARAVPDGNTGRSWTLSRKSDLSTANQTIQKSSTATAAFSGETITYFLDTTVAPTTSSRIGSVAYQADSQQIYVETDIFDSQGLTFRQNGINVTLPLLGGANPIYTTTFSYNNQNLFKEARVFETSGVVGYYFFERVIYIVPKRNDIAILENNQQTYYNMLNQLYLLDNIPSASMAISLNKINSTYTGSVLNVRRSSDNNTTDIGFASNGTLDTGSLLSFVGTTTSSFGFVTTWYDQSGRGLNLIQTTASRQPLIVSSGSVLTNAGYYYVRFDGVDDNLIQQPGTNINASSSISVLFNHKLNYYTGTGSIANPRLYQASQSLWNAFFQHSNRTYNLDNVTGIISDLQQSGSTLDANNWHYVVTIKSGSDSTPTWNNIIVDNVTGSFATGSVWSGSINNFMLGSNVTFTSPGKLDAKDFIIYNRALTYDQTRIIYNYIDSRVKPVLDVYQSPTAAFSLRRINSNYSGSSIDVRRTDNVTSSIGFNVYGILDTTTLLTFAGTSSLFVTRWYDQSGNGLHFTQPTASRQPRIVTSGVLETYSQISGSIKIFDTFKPAIRFDDSVSTTMFIPNSTSSFNHYNSGSSFIYASYQAHLISSYGPNLITPPSYAGARYEIFANSGTGVVNGVPLVSSSAGLFAFFDDRVVFGTGSVLSVQINGFVSGAGVQLRPVVANIPSSRNGTDIPVRVGLNNSLGLALSPSNVETSSRASMYINNFSGENVNFFGNPAYTSSVSSTANMHIGSQQNVFAFLNGYMDEVIFFPYQPSSSREFMDYINRYRQTY